jgi:hypothetical protein
MNTLWPDLVTLAPGSTICLSPEEKQAGIPNESGMIYALYTLQIIR